MAAYKRPEGRPGRRPWRAARRRAGRFTPPGDSIATQVGFTRLAPFNDAQLGQARVASPRDDLISGKPEIRPQDPLDFALAFMRDDSKPDALRVSVAKAALPYLHKRGEERAKDDAGPEPEPKPEPMSDLELARRIAHILARGNAQQDREAAAKTAARNEGGREAGGALPPPGASPQAGKQQESPSAPVAREDERAPAVDPFDPHPGYRWI